jgi:hypothetical protein
VKNNKENLFGKSSRLNFENSNYLQKQNI